jgi:hypothetical protein
MGWLHRRNTAQPAATGLRYEVLEMESGDVLAHYSSLEAVRSALLDHLDGHPGAEVERAVAITDDHGNALTVLPATDFLAAT